VRVLIRAEDCMPPQPDDRDTADAARPSSSKRSTGTQSRFLLPAGGGIEHVERQPDGPNGHDLNRPELLGTVRQAQFSAATVLPRVDSVSRQVDAASGTMHLDAGLPRAVMHCEQAGHAELVERTG